MLSRINRLADKHPTALPAVGLAMSAVACLGLWNESRAVAIGAVLAAVVNSLVLGFRLAGFGRQSPN